MLKLNQQSYYHLTVKFDLTHLTEEQACEVSKDFSGVSVPLLSRLSSSSSSVDVNEKVGDVIEFGDNGEYVFDIWLNFLFNVPLEGIINNSFVLVFLGSYLIVDLVCILEAFNK